MLLSVCHSSAWTLCPHLKAKRVLHTETQWDCHHAVVVSGHVLVQELWKVNFLNVSLFLCHMSHDSNCCFQSPGPEKTQNKSKETSPVLLCTETLPDGNFSELLESNADTEQTRAQNNADSVEQHQRHPPKFLSGRQASLPDVPSSSGMLGLHRPVSDPGLPGK